MSTEDTNATRRGSGSNDLLGQASEAVPLVERLRTDVLWHRRRCNETVARDCQEAADEIERLREELALCCELKREYQERADAERERCKRAVYDATDWAHDERDFALKEAIVEWIDKGPNR